MAKRKTDELNELLRMLCRENETEVKFFSEMSDVARQANTFVKAFEGQGFTREEAIEIYQTFLATTLMGAMRSIDE